MAELGRSIYLAGMKETQGERIVTAIQKLAEKIHKLELQRQQSRRSVESLSAEEISGTKASDMFQRLAKAEARCNALQQQLSHIRKIVRESSTLHFQDSNSSHKSNPISDASTTFGSVPSLPSLLQDSSETENKTRHLPVYVSSGHFNTDGQSVIEDNVKSKLNFSSPSILEIPVEEHFKNSFSSGDEKLRFSNYGSKSGVTKEHYPGSAGTKSKLYSVSKGFHNQKEHKSKLDEASRLSSSETSSQSVLNAVPGNASHIFKKTRKRLSSVCKEKSGFRTPLGHSLPSSNVKSNLVSHYHVKMNEIPFCSATTAGKSHSLGANLQNLMSMVKVCHPALCTAMPLHRRRSRSMERRSPYVIGESSRSNVRQKMTRWNSVSALDSLKCRHQCRSRLSATEDSVPYTQQDLDLVPVKLKANRENVVPQNNRGKCETPGNVCIKTEIKSLPVGRNKVVEVKMTTSKKPKCDRFGRWDPVSKRRELLKDVQQLQHVVESDQCCC